MYNSKGCAFFLFLISCTVSNHLSAQLINATKAKISIVNKNWQPGGLFSDKKPQQEILSERTECTKKFNRSNGLIDIYFGGPFHYRDLGGAWQDINLDIKTQNKPKFKYANKENIFISQFAENANNGVQMTYKKQLVSFGINTICSSGNWSPQAYSNRTSLVKDNTIEYKNIYKNIDLKYELSSNAILHKVLFNTSDIFSDIPAQQQFVSVEEMIQIPEDAVLKDNGGIINSNKTIKGNIFIVLNGDTLYTIKSANIRDASFTGNADEQSQSQEIIDAFKTVQTTVRFLSKTTVKLIVLIPVSWLKSPDRVYPITLDPTVNVGNAGSFSSYYRYPFNTCRQQRLSQIFFKKSDINAGGINTTGTITDIAFFQNSANPLVNNNVEVKMQEVTWTSMTTSTPTSSGWSTVYGPSNEDYTSGSNIWRSLSLSNPFSYTNTNNLLIEVSFSNSTYTTGCSCTNTAPGGYWAWYNAPYAGHRWAYSNNSSSPPSGTDCNYVNSPEDNPAYGYFIPITKITVNTTSGCIPISINSNPGSQAVVAPAQALFSVSIAGTSPSYQWEMSSNGGGSWNSVPSSSPYSGTTTNQLTISATGNGMNGTQYRCKMSNSCTTSAVTSSIGVLTVNGAGCSTSLTPTSSSNISIAGGGGSFSINVTPNTCSWSASANQPWITITSPYNGTGDATLNYIVSANTDAAHNGAITVNGQSYTVSQQGIGIPTTYAISGRVVNNGSSGIPNVNISTTPLQGTTVTDANGYYTLRVPNSYVGSVSARLLPFTFTPASLPVTSSNNINKDFDATSVSVSITSSTIPPWQREGDDYNGSVTVQINNTTTNSWHLEVDVYEGINHVGNVVFPNTTSTSYQFNTSITSSAQNQQLKNLSLNGRTIKYAAVFDANTTIQAYPGVSTSIIEKKWDMKNYVYYNTPGEILKIPLRYLSGVTSVSVSFKRDDLKSRGMLSTFTSSDNIVPGTLTQNVNQQYLFINSNLHNVSPGEFDYTISYNGSGIQEQGRIDLIKIGQINGVPSNKIVVFVGGIWNELEKNIQAFNSSSTNLTSNDPFSVAAYIGNNSNFSTWYIGMGNTNYIRNNAYDLGIALQMIKRKTNPTEIDLVVHSAGGLEARALLGVDQANLTDRTLSLNGEIFNFRDSMNINTLIKKVIFIATPHKGVYADDILEGFQAVIPWRNITPLINDLNGFGYYIPHHILYALKNTPMPNNIYFANLTGYINFFIPSDVIVRMGSSMNPYIGNNRSAVQMYQNAGSLLNYILHTNIHRNKLLSLDGNEDNCTQNESNLIKISNFLLAQNPPAFVQSCIVDIHGNYSINVSGSILSNAQISIKRHTDSLYTHVTSSDENGKFIFETIGELSHDDSIRIDAQGYETLYLKVDDRILTLKKMSIPMLKSASISQKVSHPSLSLQNNTPVVNTNSINLRVTGQNVIQFQINNPLTQDSIFIPLPLNNNIALIHLDTGFNNIIIKFISQLDTAIVLKKIYYFPNSIASINTGILTINSPQEFIGTKMYGNQIYYSDILSTSSNVKILNRETIYRFSKYGYRDTSITIDTTNTIALLLQPYSYSSMTDTAVFNFAMGSNPQYWKSITIKNLSTSNNRQLSVMQYDDSFVGMSLKPLTRKFVFRRLYSGNPASYKTAITLDQISTPDKDSAYLLTRKGKFWIKCKANQTNISEYDPEVQKFEFDKLNFDNNNTYELCLMQKQAPIMKELDTVWHSGQTIAFPLSIFAQDPDSIKNDIAISSIDAKVSVVGDLVYITAPVNFVGITSYSLTGIHDYLEVSKSYKMKVIPPEVYIPTAFTPNNDGVNDILRPFFLGKVANCHLTIFNRNGQKVFDTQDCLSGWDGRFKGEVLDPGTFVYYLTYQFEGEIEKQKKGSFVLLK